MDEQSTTLGTLDADCTTTTSDLSGITPSGWATERRRARRDPPGSAAAAHGILGESVALREVVSLAQTVASTDAVVLIRGETGTGKELHRAVLIHALSSARRPSVSSSSTARPFPPALLESELFGHERGAFTGAVAQRDRPVRAGARGHALPRRDRRAAARAAGEAPARAPGAGVRARRRHARRSRSTCASSPPRTATRRGRSRRARSARISTTG